GADGLEPPTDGLEPPTDGLTPPTDGVIEVRSDPSDSDLLSSPSSWLRTRPSSLSTAWRRRSSSSRRALLAASVAFAVFCALARTSAASSSAACRMDCSRLVNEEIRSGLRPLLLAGSGSRWGSGRCCSGWRGGTGGGGLGAVRGSNRPGPPTWRAAACSGACCGAAPLL